MIFPMKPIMAMVKDYGYSMGNTLGDMTGNRGVKVVSFDLVKTSLVLA